MVLSPDHTSGTATVHLFGGPYVSSGGKHLAVPEGSKRLLAFVALRRGRVERRHAAGALWPTGDDTRAAGNLRSALWRLRGAGIEVLCSDKWSLCLGAAVQVDVHRLSSWADRMITGRHRPADLDRRDLEPDGLDLLPGWYDDWTTLERERLRHRVLHGLEAQSRALGAAGRHADAVETAMVAIQAEPLRESAQRTLVEAHLAMGNLHDARRALARYRHLLRRELGVEPSADLVALVHARMSAVLPRRGPVTLAAQA